MTNRQIKRKSQTFSLSDDEMAAILERAKHHGFRSRNDYILALVEAEIALSLEVTLSPTKERVLRPMTDIQRVTARLAATARR